MPYSGADDPKLPAHVKKMSTKKRRQWIHVWESEMAKHSDEGRAFASANSVAGHKELTVVQNLVDDFELDSDSMPLVDDEKERNLFEAAIKGIKSFFNPTIIETDIFGEGPMRFYKSIESDGTTLLRFMAVVSNNFKDREQETIPEYVHKEYVDWATRTEQYPMLQLWHSGALSKWGQTDWLDMSDGFLVASGTVDSGKEHIAKSVAKDGKDIGVSHGFYSKKEGNIITWYRTFEISPLPMWAAANEHTSYNLLEEGTMPFSKEKRDWLAAKGMKPEAIAEFESSLNNFAKELKARGVDYKDFEPAIDAGTTVTAETEATKDAAKAETATADTKALEAFDTRLTGIETSVKALTEAFTTSMAKLSKSQDEQVAGFFKSAVSTLPQGFRASESADNTDSANAAAKSLAEVEKKQRENGWFSDIVLGGMK